MIERKKKNRKKEERREGGSKGGEKGRKGREEGREGEGTEGGKELGGLVTFFMTSLLSHSCCWTMVISIRHQ